MENITFSELIRTEAGLSRAEFSRRYNIPLRTLEEWDAGRREPSQWVIDLLARAVLEDLCEQVKPVYEVVEIGKHDEWLELKTGSYTEAILVARDLEERKEKDAELRKHIIEIRYNIVEYSGGISYDTLNY